MSLIIINKYNHKNTKGFQGELCKIHPLINKMIAIN
jgi:hypothetical protein